MKVDIYIAGNNPQPKAEERWMGYLIQAEGYGRRGERCGAESLDATSYKATIMMIISVLDHFTRPADITMHIENGWIVGNLIRTKQADKSMKNQLELWQENGWQTKRGTTVKNKDDWQRLYNKLRVFEQAGGNFSFEILEKDDKNRNRIIQEIEKQIKEV